LTSCTEALPAEYLGRKRPIQLLQKKKHVVAQEVSKPLFSNFGVLQTRAYFGKSHTDWMSYCKAVVRL